MPRQMPTTLRPRILALKPAEEASSSRSKSAAAVPDVNAPSRTVRLPFRLFDPFSAGLDQFQPTAFMAPVRTSVATEFNSGERTYSTIKPRSPPTREPRGKSACMFWLRVGCDYLVTFSAGLPSSVRHCFGQPCSPFEAGALPVLRPTRRIHIRLRGRVLCNPPRLKGFRSARPRP